MPNVPSAQDQTGNEHMHPAETMRARVAKFHVFASLESTAQEMIEKHVILHDHSRGASRCKRAGKRKHSHRFSWRASGALLIAFATLGCAARGATTAEPRSAAKLSSSTRSPFEVPRTVITPDGTTDITELSK